MANVRIARRSGRVFRGGGARRQTQWIGGAFLTSTIAAADTAVQVQVFNAAALALRPFTIIRTRGWLSISSDQTTTSENQELVYGVAVVTDQANAIGVTAVPTPSYSYVSHNWSPSPSNALTLSTLSR